MCAPGCTRGCWGCHPVTGAGGSSGTSGNPLAGLAEPCVVLELECAPTVPTPCLCVGLVPGELRVPPLCRDGCSTAARAGASWVPGIHAGGELVLGWNGGPCSIAGLGVV